MSKRYRSKKNTNYRNGYKSKRRSYKKSKISKDTYISKADKNAEEKMYVKNATFSDFSLNKIIQKNIQNKGYVHPTKIQNEAIPLLLKGRDVLGLAATGSGKTAAFLLPIINKILDNNYQRCLIVVPTRELANQVQKEIRDFSKDTFIKEVLVIGGASYKVQINLLQRDPHFVVATPGRLIDLFKQNKIDLKKFNNIVLDEVDEMLDMGFIKDIELIISKLAFNKQSMFFSATMNKKSESISNRFLNNPVKVQMPQEAVLANIEQNIVKYGIREQKLNVLHNLLVNTDYSKVLVFSKTRKGADVIAKHLKNKGHQAGVIHGQKSQSKRHKAMSQFRNNDIDVLVATDVAARGIDVPNISHIINYDEPATYNDYIHRIGRTGRMGKKGTALTFVK